MILDFLRKLLSKNKQNLQNSIYYFGGSITLLIISFFSLPIYAKYLSAEDFGILGYYGSIQGMFTPLFLFGMTQYYMMNYFRQNEQKNKVLLFNILANLSVLNLIVSIIGFFSLQYGFYKFDVSVPFQPFSIFIFIILYFNIYLSFILINLRVRKNAKTYLLISIIPPILNVVFGLLFVIKFEMGAAGKMLGQVVTNIIMGGVSIVFLWKYLSFQFIPKFLVKSLKYVLPLVAAGYAYYPIKSIDKLYLERLGNLAELGYYNIGFTAANFISLACAALFIAFEPDIYRYVSNNQFSRLKKIAILYFTIVIFFVFLFITTSPYLIEFLTSGRYTRAYKYANLFAIGVVFMQIFGFSNGVIIAMKKTKIALYINIIGAISALILYKILIAKYSFYGANYAFIIVAMIMAFSSLLFIKYFRKKEVLTK